jgi:hypothetical protein
MPTATGQISLKGVNGELRQVLGASVSMGAASGRTLAGVPSGQISMSNYQGKTVGSTSFFIINGSSGAEAYSWSSGFSTKFSAPTGTASGYGSANQQGTDSGIALLGDVVFRGCVSTPRIWARKFTSSGWGTLYSTNAINQQLTSSTRDMAVHPNGNLVAYLTGINWYLDIFDFFSETVDSLSAGWGCEYLIPFAYGSGTLAYPGTAQKMEWSRGGRAIAVGHIASPYITVYPFDGVTSKQTTESGSAQYTRGSGFGTIYSNPGTLPSDYIAGITFTNSAVITASRQTTSNGWLEAWAWSDSTGFGTKYSNPSSDFTAYKSPNRIRSSPNQSYIAVAGGWSSSNPSTTKTDCLFLYAWDNSSGFGTLYSNPTSSFTSNNTSSGANDVAWTNDSAAVAFTASIRGTSTAPYGFAAWAVSSGWGSKYSDPASNATSTLVHNAAFK